MVKKEWLGRVGLRRKIVATIERWPKDLLGSKPMGYEAIGQMGIDLVANKARAMHSANVHLYKANAGKRSYFKQKVELN